MTDAIAFSRPFAWERVQPKGTTVTIEANADECRAVAEALDILSVSSLRAEVTLTPWRKTGYKMTGRVEADVEQACVVTLDPVAEHVSEAIEITFLPADEIKTVDEEIEIDVEAEDPAEPIEGTMVDLGLFATEFVAIGLDPYPRKPGATFEGFIEDDGSEDKAPSPFAGLAGLKDREP